MGSAGSRSRKAIIETAFELYVELKRRGLHLRQHGNGRDGSLLRELCDAVGCPDDQLQRYLQDTPLPAAELLLAFMDAAAPFARMYQEIWAYLDTVRARRATETLRLRVAPGEAPIELEQFREWAEAAGSMLQLRELMTWPASGLIEVAKAARSLGLGLPRGAPYRPGLPYKLPVLELTSLPRDSYVQLLVHVHRLLQEEIDDAARLHVGNMRIRMLPEIILNRPNLNPKYAPWELADLVPLWQPLFDLGINASADTRSRVLQAFEDHVRPYMVSTKVLAPEEVRRRIEILALPFWRHRWRTYEIWITIETLRGLARFVPVPSVHRGVVPLDVSTSSVVATMRCADRPSACVVAQMKTRFAGRRRAIQPDLSICFDDRRRASSRAFVVEAKQRASLTAAHVCTVGENYRDGSPEAIGVVIINYDDNLPMISPLDRVRILGGVRPGTVGADELQKELVRLADVAGLRPLPPTAVMLDVSGSMKNHYHGRAATAALRRLLAMEHIRIVRFNERLLPGGDIGTETAATIATSGGTNLEYSFRELTERFGAFDIVLVVSDGKYANAPSLQRVRFRRRVSPVRLWSGLEWLLAPTATSRSNDPATGKAIRVGFRLPPSR